MLENISFLKVTLTENKKIDLTLTRTEKEGNATLPDENLDIKDKSTYLRRRIHTQLCAAMSRLICYKKESKSDS